MQSFFELIIAKKQRKIKQKSNILIEVQNNDGGKKQLAIQATLIHSGKKRDRKSSGAIVFTCEFMKFFTFR